MRNGVIAVLLVVAILAGAGMGYFIRTETTQPACDIAPQGSVLYVRITLDGDRTPVTNATVEAVPVETCNGVNTTIAILMQPPVNATGAATLDGSYDTFLSVTVHYGNQSYPFDAYVNRSLMTCANLSVPSGSLSISSC
jgi:hypothetical protein